MSRKNLSLRVPLTSTNQILGPFITNVFGKYLSYLNKHIKSPFPPVRRKPEDTLFTARSNRSFSPISSINIGEISRISITQRSGSSVNISRSNITLSNLTIEKKRLHSRHDSYSFTKKP